MKLGGKMIKIYKFHKITRKTLIFFEEKIRILKHNSLKENCEFWIK